MFCCKSHPSIVPPPLHMSFRRLWTQVPPFYFLLSGETLFNVIRDSHTTDWLWCHCVYVGAVWISKATCRSACVDPPGLWLLFFVSIIIIALWPAPSSEKRSTILSMASLHFQHHCSTKWLCSVHHLVHHFFERKRILECLRVTTCSRENWQTATIKALVKKDDGNCVLYMSSCCFTLHECRACCSCSCIFDVCLLALCFKWPWASAAGVLAINNPVFQLSLQIDASV